MNLSKGQIDGYFDRRFGMSVDGAQDIVSLNSRSYKKLVKWMNFSLNFFGCFAQGSTYRTVISTRTVTWLLSSWPLCLRTVIYLIISSICFNIILNNWFFQIQKKWSFHKLFFSAWLLLMDCILKHKMLFIITAQDTITEMLSVSDFVLFLFFIRKQKFKS